MKPIPIFLVSQIEEELLSANYELSLIESFIETMQEHCWANLLSIEDILEDSKINIYQINTDFVTLIHYLRCLSITNTQVLWNDE